MRTLIECGALAAVVELLASSAWPVRVAALRVLERLAVHAPVRAALHEQGALQPLLDVLAGTSAATPSAASSAPADAQAAALAVLSLVAADAASAEALANSGELARLAALLAAPVPSVQRSAVALLRALALHAALAPIVLATPGLVSALVALLGHAHAEVRDAAAALLLSAQGEEARAELLKTPHALSALLHVFVSARDADTKARAIELLVQLAARDVAQNTLREPAALTALVEHLFFADARVQSACARLLALVVHSEAEARRVHELGAVLALTAALQSPSVAVVDAACAALRVLARDDVCRAALIEQQTLARLLALCLDARVEDKLLPALATLDMLVRDPRLAAQLGAEDSLRVLAALLRAPSARVRTAVIAVLMRLDWDALVQLAGLAALLVLAASSHAEAQRRAVHELAELSVETSYRRAMLEDATLLPALSALLRPEAETRPMGAPVQVEALLVLANLSLDAPQRLEPVLAASVDFLSLDYGPSAAFSAARILANVARASPALPVLRAVLRAGAVSKLVQLVHSAQGDQELLHNALCVLRVLATTREDATPAAAASDDEDAAAPQPPSASVRGLALAELAQLNAVRGLVPVLLAALDTRVLTELLALLHALAASAPLRAQLCAHPATLRALVKVDARALLAQLLREDEGDALLEAASSAEEDVAALVTLLLSSAHADNVSVLVHVCAQRRARALLLRCAATLLPEPPRPLTPLVLPVIRSSCCAQRAPSSRHCARREMRACSR